LKGSNTCIQYGRLVEGSPWGNGLPGGHDHGAHHFFKTELAEIKFLLALGEYIPSLESLDPTKKFPTRRRSPVGKIK